MKSLKLLMTIALTLALAVPALSLPHDGCLAGTKGNMFLLSDLTEEELNNMTLAEIRELQQQKLAEIDNMTLAELKANRDTIRQERVDDRENMTLAEIKEQWKEAPYGRGTAEGKTFTKQARGYEGGDGLYGQNMWMGLGGPIILFADLAPEDMDNMTLAEIRELQQQKMAEMDNMTLAELKADRDMIRQERIDDRGNMTLAEIKGQWLKGCGNQDRIQVRNGAKKAVNQDFGWDSPGRCGGQMMGLCFAFNPLMDLTQEELDNMTLGEIRELQQQKMEELDNMTLAEIRELQQQNIEDMGNTTLGNLRDQRRDRIAGCNYGVAGGACTWLGAN